MSNLNTTSVEEGKWDTISAVLFGLVFCDSLITYFGSITGRIQPALVTIILFSGFVIIRRFRHILPTEKVIAWLSLMVTGFLIGIVTAPDIGLERVPQLISASIAFLIGYYFFRYNTNEKKIYWFLVILSVLYIVVCVIALLKISPHYFPLEVSLWADGYSINERPAITTDQNFQLFYLILPILLIMLPVGWLRFFVVLVLLIGSAFVLVRLQTRSGILVFIGGLLMALAYPFISRKSEKKKVIILLAIGFVIVILMLPLVLHEIGPLLTRFLSTGREHATEEARITSVLYIFDIVWNPLYWLPQGNPTYLEGANKPHSNIAAIFLEAGIFGLIGWVMLFVKPVFLLGKQYYSKNGDRIAGMVFVAGAMVLVLQLSLNVPVMDQVWLWAGAVNGILEKVKFSKRKINKNINSFENEKLKCINLTSC